MVRRRLRVKNLILAIISLILVCTLIYSASKIIMWFMDNNKTDNVIKKVQDIVEVEDTSNTEVIEVKEEIDEFNPYWDYIDMKLINVNIEFIVKKRKIMI